MFLARLKLIKTAFYLLYNGENKLSNPFRLKRNFEFNGGEKRLRYPPNNLKTISIFGKQKIDILYNSLIDDRFIIFMLKS